jgi:tetratricopeptide (TPR) repeat protein
MMNISNKRVREASQAAKEHRLNAAESLISEALVYDANCKEAWALKGLIAFAQGGVEKSIHAWQRFLTFEGCEKDKFVLAWLKESKNVVPAVNKARELYNRALASLEQAGDEKSAINDLKESTRLHDSFLEAHKLLAAVFCKTGEMKMAVSEWGKALSVNKEDTDALLHLNNLGMLGMSVPRPALRKTVWPMLISAAGVFFVLLAAGGFALYQGHALHIRLETQLAQEKVRVETTLQEKNRVFSERQKLESKVEALTDERQKLESKVEVMTGEKQKMIRALEKTKEDYEKKISVAAKRNEALRGDKVDLEETILKLKKDLLAKSQSSRPEGL